MSTELIEKIFTRESGCYDAKHINNLSDKRTSRELLERVERGVTLEELEKIEFPVCRYMTQITIHGIFPEQETSGYVLGYKHVFQNINKSIGVRYGAIDAEKKDLLRCINGAAKRKELSRWNARHNSSEFAFERAIPVHTIEEAREQAKHFKEFFDAVPADLFYGGFDIRLVKDMFGRVYLEVYVPVNAIREEKVDSFAKMFFGLSVAEYRELVKEDEQKRQEEREQRENELQRTIENSKMLLEKYIAENGSKLIKEPPKEGLFHFVYIAKYDGKIYRNLRRAVILKNGKTQYYRVKNAEEIVNTRSKKNVVEYEVLKTGTLFLV